METRLDVYFEGIIMNILAICGSPRKGNTEFMVNVVLDSIINHEKELILLREKEINRCLGCHKGYKKKECVIKDDMQEICEKMVEADVLFIGSPNYFDNVSGLLKDFMDRTNSFYKTGAFKGKKVYVLASGGMSKEHTQKVIDAIHIFARAHEMEFVRGVICENSEDKEAKDQEDLIKELKELGKEINSL
jgi:multimeric flavodoxin WrbA